MSDDITQTAMFGEAARLAREDSRRYWAMNGKHFPQQKLPNWPPGWAGKQAAVSAPPTRILRAARWLADADETPHHVIPTLQKRFRITAAECVEAIRLAETMRRVGP